MSGHADYTAFNYKIPDNIKVYEVPIIHATQKNLKGFCNVVHEYENTSVINVKWPKITGWRKLDENTGDQALHTEGMFDFYYDDIYSKAVNHSVENGSYITGIIPRSEKKSGNEIPTHIYTREANYHPDGGQIIFPPSKEPFMLLLSKKGDDILPEDFFCFFCDGSFGVQILPNVWHQPAYPLNNKATFKNKQCSVHGCVTVDTVNEFNTLLRVNLNL